MATLAYTENFNEDGSLEEEVGVTGKDFTPNTNIELEYGYVDKLDTMPNRTIVTDDSGGFVTTFLPPPFYGTRAIKASDGTNSAEINYTLIREPQYCSVANVADRLRIDIGANTDPNIRMIKRFIMQNEDDFDRETMHTFTKDKLVTEVVDVTRLWHWLRGMAVYMHHRNIREFDPARGDKVEVFDGLGWRTASLPNSSGVYVEGYKGIVYIRGYIFTLLVKNRFRITYRYGGDSQGLDIPLDISKAIELMTASDVLESDFKMSQIAYGGDANINKSSVLDKWAKDIERIKDNHRELITIW